MNDEEVGFMSAVESMPRANSDPRGLLRDWANSSDEWVRYIVRQVLSTGRALASEHAEYAYELFRQEKSLDARVLDPELPLVMTVTIDEAEEPLAITALSDVTGVNALVAGAVIEPHEGLTILFGENGTGKTGYSRIFKALAASRTADVILGDVVSGAAEPRSARIRYTLGGQSKELVWAGEQGISPFIRMSIFDSPSVSFHVDDELEYVYVPAALALFNHVIAGIKSVQSSIDATTTELRTGATTILSRIPRESTSYPLIETLGASTDLEDLKSRADEDPKIDERIEGLRMAVAALEADTIGAQIAWRERAERVLTQASAIAEALKRFDVPGYNTELANQTDLENDYRAFRFELFRAADLPAEPDDNWETFVSAGEAYRTHLASMSVHDAERCLYCRQPLEDQAHVLVAKYGEYLADKINQDITATKNRIQELASSTVSTESGEVSTFVAEYIERDDKPTHYQALAELNALLIEVQARFESAEAIDIITGARTKVAADVIDTALTMTVAELVTLRGQAQNRAGALTEKKNALSELIAAAELVKSWNAIELQVRNAKEADRLSILAKPLPGLLRTVTGLTKTASDQLINQSFDALFAEECAALRAPVLKVEFVGRQGRAQRRKVLSGKHKPSKVLSEGEQKVLAMADFLAEARLAGISAPVVFDDPVSSLDHRRINEVAQRVALLAESTQVIVFTHDIFFATTLLSLFEKSRRCNYFHITDDDGKGKVTRATGPRWDSLSNLKKNVNETIVAARSVDGEARAALVRTGYDWIRAWCEVFTEIELLQGVTQRYQPNVRMTSLVNIKTGALPATIDTVNRIFVDACRYIDGHSQPLATLGVSPTLPGLEAHWAELQETRRTYGEATD